MKISEQATAFAEQNFQHEADWYRTYCGGEISYNRLAVGIFAIKITTKDSTNTKD